MEVQICLIICCTLLLIVLMIVICAQIDSHSTYIPTESIDKVNEKLDKIVELLQGKR